jgi:hypothetical protein
MTHLMTSSREMWQSFPAEKRAQAELNVDLDNLESNARTPMAQEN